jgi:PEGA domain-containing protein
LQYAAALFLRHCQHFSKTRRGITVAPSLVKDWRFTVTPRLRITFASLVIFTVVLAIGSADAQRTAVPRSPAPQGHHAVPRPLPARPLPGGHYYRGPNVYRPYYASPYYWYGGFYGGYYYSYPLYFSAGVGPYAPYYYGYPWYPYDPAASLRLQVTPRHAEVFVDGSYAGTVDDFDGSFQRLRLYPGDHTVEVFLPGHRTLMQRIYLQPGKTFTVRAALQALSPGEPDPVRPSSEIRQPRGSQPPPAASAQEEEGGEEWPQVGMLALRVQPVGAAVTIDGEVWEGSGAGGPLVLQLATGVHTIEIRKEGYRTYLTELPVRQGETTTLNVAMTPDK